MVPPARTLEGPSEGEGFGGPPLRDMYHIIHRYDCLKTPRQRPPKLSQGSPAVKASSESTNISTQFKLDFESVLTAEEPSKSAREEHKGFPKILIVV